MGKHTNEDYDRLGESPEYLRESAARREPAWECDGCGDAWAASDLTEAENGDHLCPKCIADLEALTEELRAEQEPEPVVTLGDLQATVDEISEKMTALMRGRFDRPPTTKEAILGRAGIASRLNGEGTLAEYVENLGKR